LDEDLALPKYVLYALAKIGFKNIEMMANGQSGQIELPIETISSIKIPLPPLDVQQKIVAEIEEIERGESNIIAHVETMKVSISEAISHSSRDERKNEKLSAVVQYSQERVPCVGLSSDTYVGVDNLLQNMAGKTISQFVPNSGTATSYSEGDILLSNIRPYLKKIWLADNNGGSSGDVLVLKVDKARILPEYLFYLLAKDEFFEYEMQHVKGQKMPRADKASVLNFIISVPSLPEQQKAVATIKKIEGELKIAQGKLAALKVAKDDVLQKYL
jgi:type I restriction enzyme M protein